MIKEIYQEYSTTGTPQYIFFPDDGIAYGKESIFKYDYEDGKKIQYAYNNPINRNTKNKEIKFYINCEYYYDNNYLSKIITHPLFIPEKVFSISNFTYNKNMNLIETSFEDSLIDNKKSITRIKYEYDEKNRLKKRIIYYPDSIIKNKIDEIEEYIYEDGKYIYYPYLLPTKIKMYLYQAFEISVDKFVF